MGRRGTVKILCILRLSAPGQGWQDRDWLLLGFLALCRLVPLFVPQRDHAATPIWVSRFAMKFNHYFFSMSSVLVFHLLGRVSDQRSSSKISLFQPVQANPKNLKRYYTSGLLQLVDKPAPLTIVPDHYLANQIKKYKKWDGDTVQQLCLWLATMRRSSWKGRRQTLPEWGRLLALHSEVIQMISWLDDIAWITFKIHILWLSISKEVQKQHCNEQWKLKKRIQR